MRKRLLILFVLSVLSSLLWAAAQTPIRLAEPILGGALDAPIRIETFSDYQCPACRTLYLETMRPALQDYASKDKVCLIYHDFPLPIHQYARSAARYSQAAQRIGHKQWLAVVDALYTDQARWSADGTLEATIIKALSPEDFARLKTALLDPTINDAIDREVALGQKREVKSTPTFFVTAIGREQRVEGGLPYTVLKDFLDRIVK